MFRRMCSARILFGGLFFGLGLLGCEDDHAKEIDDCIQESIQQGKRAFWIQGEWLITGEGERSGCENSLFNANQMDIQSQRIRVHQQGHFVFLESGQQEVLPGFSLSGLVGDRCIHIKTVDETSEGRMSFDFPGRFLGPSMFHGKFRGKGPAGCESKGEFTVSVKLDPVPAHASKNPAPSDAGTSQEELCESCRASCYLIDNKFLSACLASCDRYICELPDGGLPDAEADVAEMDADADSHFDAEDPDGEVGLDAESDVFDEDVNTDQDADLDADLDADSDDAGEDLTDGAGLEDADGGDGSDAGVDASSSDLEYTLWSGKPAKLEDAPRSGCSFTVVGGRANSWWLLGIVLVVSGRVRVRIRARSV